MTLQIEHGTDKEIKKEVRSETKDTTVTFMSLYKELSTK